MKISLDEIYSDLLLMPEEGRLLNKYFSSQFLSGRRKFHEIDFTLKEIVDRLERENKLGSFFVSPDSPGRSNFFFKENDVYRILLIERSHPFIDRTYKDLKKAVSAWLSLRLLGMCIPPVDITD